MSALAQCMCCGKPLPIDDAARHCSATCALEHEERLCPCYRGNREKGATTAGVAKPSISGVSEGGAGA